MKEIEYLKEKNELVDIVHCAFNDWDDYNEECYESHISPIEDVEDFVADAVLHAGYRKQSEGEWKFHKDGSGTCSECHITQKNIWDYDNWQNFCGHCGAKMKGGAGWLQKNKR